MIEVTVQQPLAERLKACRLYAGLTQKALARRTGIPEDKICALEVGRTRGYLDEIRTIVWFTGCGDQEQDITQCWRDFNPPPPVPKTDKQQEVICYDGAQDE